MEKLANLSRVEMVHGREQDCFVSTLIFSLDRLFLGLI
jgi:hypothetical protein